MKLVALLASAASAQMLELSPISSDGLADIMNMVNQLTMSMPSAPMPMPRNPCAQDMERLGCASAPCLVANLARLSDQCARLVVAPSPSPVTVSHPMMDPLALFGGLAERIEMGRPEMDVEISVEDADDEWEVASSSFGGSIGFPPEFNALLQTLPIEVATMFTDVAMPIARPRPPPPAAVHANAHPCAAEVAQCTKETGSTGRSAIETCLLAHYDELNPSCKCFMHQVMDSSSALKARAPAATAAPALRTVPNIVEQPPTEPMAHVTCMLFMPLMVIAIALLIRRCCLCCFERKPVFAAIVPPEQATINTVQPLICVPIAPPLKPEEEEQAKKQPKPTASA